MLSFKFLVFLACFSIIVVANIFPNKHVPLTLGVAAPPAQDPLNDDFLGREPQWQYSRDMQACNVLHYRQTTDHFNFGQPRGEKYFHQRYFFCPKHWRKGENGTAGPIFFYSGNEGDLELYVNNTGLMWENAEKYQALLVFAEHRYYGQTVPNADLSYLTVEQAMADYVELVRSIKREHSAEKAPVIVFGGSYGGMLSFWLRLKYPGTFHGAIAASAPFLMYIGAPYTETYFHTVTRDASASAGSAEMCTANVKATWSIMSNLAKTSSGREIIEKAFRLCEPLSNPKMVNDLAELLVDAWSSMAMGNYPFPSSYLTAAFSDSTAPLPAWPVRKACSYLANKTLANDPPELLNAMRSAVGVYVNATGHVPCLSLASTFAGEKPWVYQTCTELFSRDQFESYNGKQDMFFQSDETDKKRIKTCQESFGVQPLSDWHTLTFGTVEEIAHYGSNIVFSNGNFDPWYGAGMLHDLNPTIVAVVIDQGAHHADLMFSTSYDSQSMIRAREIEKMHMDNWIKEAYQSYAA